MNGRYLERFAWLSLATGFVVLGLKTLAWQLTGSVGLLSDALESTVNIGAALVALFALRAANRPADAEHHFGHGKAEYLSAMVEGFLILAASAAIIATAILRLLNPQPLEKVGLGLAVSVLASVLNGVVAAILIRVGTRHRSLVLVADGKHLLTDVWTSVGVVVAVGAVALTNWEVMDPIIALAVGANILWTGWGLLRQSVSGLLDQRLSDADIDRVVQVLAARQSGTVQFHALQSRASGRQRFVSLHMLVPGVTPVRQAHDLAQDIEDEIIAALPETVVSIHIEPLEDPRAWDDIPHGAEHPLHPSRGPFGQNLP